MYLALFFQSDNFIRERISVVCPSYQLQLCVSFASYLRVLDNFFFQKSNTVQCDADGGSKNIKKKKADFMKLSACVRLLIHLFAFFFIFFIFFFHFFSFSFLRKRTLESPCRLRSKFSKPEKHQQTDRLKEDYRNA